jgi:hypothetical protein
MHLTFEQWTALCQLLIFPLCVWAIKLGTKVIVNEIRGAVDSRADRVAVKRTAEVKVIMDEGFKAIHVALDDHENRDIERQEGLKALFINGNH